HRREKHKMIIETEILLRDLKLGHDLRMPHRAEERMKRLARLEIYWPILYLEQDVRRKLAVEWLQVLVRRTGAVVAGLHVVDKRTPHNDPSMRSERCGEHICAVSMRSVVRSWTRLAFAVCLDEKTAEVGNQLVDLIGLPLPPLDHGRVERIGSRQLPQLDR